MTIVLLTILNVACEQDLRTATEGNYDVRQDSTYIPWRDSLTLYVDIERDEYLSIPAMNNWEDIVRLRGTTSWGTFDYICSIYDEKNKRIQLIKQNPWYHEDGVNYIYKERILSEEEYYEIMMMLDSINYYEMPFDLEPDRMILDGSEYTLAVKKGKNTKVVFWQDEIRIESEYKRNIMKVFKDILLRANYPYPKGIIFMDSDITDSVSCKIGLDDYDLSMDYYAEYNSTKLPKVRGMPSITVSVLDTNQLKEMVKIYIFMGNGEVHEIEEVIIEK